MIYQVGKYLRIFYEGMGNIFYEFPATAAPNVLDAANDGLSTDLATAKIAQLGQATGRAGDPAKLLENREIPLNGFALLLKNSGSALGAHLKIQKAAGSDALHDAQIQIFNSAGNPVGYISFEDSGNIYIGGDPAVNAITTGRQNILVGGNAGGTITTGIYNILIGNAAGYGIITESFNTIIGKDSGDNAPAAIGSSNTIIGAQQVDLGANFGDNNIYIGTFNNNSNGDTVGSRNIVIANGLGLGSTVNDLTIIGNITAGGAPIVIPNVVLLGAGPQNILVGQNSASAAFIDTGEKMQISGTVKARNNSLRIRAGIAADTFTANDNTLIMDSTAGNMTVSINPAALSTIGTGVNAMRTGIIGQVKKISADLNTITLNATSGLIYGLGAPAASLVFSAQGQSVSFQSDGTNIYIL